MLQALMNLLSLCWQSEKVNNTNNNSNSFGRGGGGGGSGRSRDSKDGLLWYKDSGKYASGDFSMAVVQANQVLEDQSQIESGSFGTFVGIYDGHVATSVITCLITFKESAKRLLKAALQEAARKREMRYSDLQKIDKKVRRHFHDDTTVIILFLNHGLISRGSGLDPPVSIQWVQ